MALFLLLIIGFPCVISKPNIILFIADDLGYGDLGCYGNHSVKTPNIDSIASEGVKMTQHIAAASVCTPSRSALLTGRYPIRTGMATPVMMRVITWASSSSGLPSSEITFAEQAKKAGYMTGLFGKWHLGFHRETLGDFDHHPLNQGFDYFYGLIFSNMCDYGGSDKIMTGLITGWYGKLFSIWAVTAIALWCLFRENYLGAVSFSIIVFSWSVPLTLVYLLFENYTLMNSFVYRNYDLVEQPVRLAGFSQRLVIEGQEFIQNATRSKTPFLLVMSSLHTHTYLTTAKNFEGRSKFGRYGDALEELDWSVGQILKSVKELGIEDNSLVYFTSDHGGHLEEGTNGGYNGILKGGKGHGASDGAIRVPGIIKWPGVLQQGKVTDEPTSLMDIYSLISSVVGVNIPSDRQIDGRDILPLLKGDVQVSPHEFMFHYCGNVLQAARYRPRKGIKSWKLVTREPGDYIPGTNLCPFTCACNFDVVLTTPKLYDITADPGETTPIDSSSETYKAITPLILKAMDNHRTSIEPVETQFTWRKLAPQLTWQPCCNGTFPFNCYCTDPKYPQ